MPTRQIVGEVNLGGATPPLPSGKVISIEAGARDAVNPGVAGACDAMISGVPRARDFKRSPAG